MIKHLCDACGEELREPYREEVVTLKNGGFLIRVEGADICRPCVMQILQNSKHPFRREEP